MSKIQLRTPVPVPDFPFAIDYGTHFSFLGSCFTENIGKRLQRLKLRAGINPFGIMYNPASLASSLDRMLSGKAYTEDELEEEGGKWFSYMHHGEFSAYSGEDCLEKINVSMEAGSRHLRKSQMVFITLGTAWVFVHKAHGKVVANCHKMPSSLFDRRLLSADEVVHSLDKISKLIRAASPHAKIIYTLSPVRHIRDGLVENQRSKAHLLTAIHRMTEEDHAAFYFPAYEILMDELRDYRFYADDLVHPSAMAVKCISEKFDRAFLHPDALVLMNEIDKIHAGMQHRPIHPDSPDAENFRKNLKEKMEALERKHGFLDFSSEKEQLKPGGCS